MHSASDPSLALAALADGKTVQQISTLYDVHPTQVQTWKKQLQDFAARAFDAGIAQPHQDNTTIIAICVRGPAEPGPVEDV